MNTMKSLSLAGALLLLFSFCAYAQGGATVTFEYGTTVGVLERDCASCHTWAKSYEGLTGAGYIRPGDPAGSPALASIESGRMPPSGPGLSSAERQGLFDWILAGAPRPMLPASDAVSGATAEASSEAPADAVTGATPAGGALPGAPFLGFKSKTDFHRFAGWTSAGLLLASGIVGAVHAYDLMTAGHEFRDVNDIDDEDDIGGGCSTEITSLWNDSFEQSLRWTHVGLLVAGESLYLADAVSGIQFMGPYKPGIDRSDIHRWAFFAHGGMMVVEAILGFITTDALKNGDHELVSELGVAHAAIGLAIPAVMIAAGSVMEFF